MFKYSLIMAAGCGSRLMPLTEKKSKAMIKIKEETLIAGAIRQLGPHISNIVVTVGHQAPLLAKHVIAQGVSLVLNTRNKGNAWWIFNSVMKYLDEPVLVLTCDNVVVLDLDFLYQNYLKSGSPSCMLVPVKPVEGIEGDYITGEKGRVISLTREYSTGIYSSGIQVVNPSMINRLMLPVNDFVEVWESLIFTRQLYYSSIYPHKWHSINTLKNLDDLKFI